ncbi:helix-turn-helix domain-containing protein [Agrobacterium vitis]|uniref:helix-turn-helix domain-containing protein n=1 Tax=Agrobacterium vitis TaxID=373 RepID=UPI0012E7D477|nr:helix-turn-helix domain-containing protein [Agrobacterium vitis]MUZ65633.1 helix-turn-helix domain-containing protein [Agrobacterium vitis]
MTEGKFLTPDEVSERYRGGISVGTLRNWRAMRIGPTFVKIGKAVLYPISELDAWDEKNTVTCRASGRATMQVDDGPGRSRTDIRNIPN